MACDRNQIANHLFYDFIVHIPGKKIWSSIHNYWVMTIKPDSADTLHLSTRIASGLSWILIKTLSPGVIQSASLITKTNKNC